ncbi:hypothetical protein Ddye_005145 [Dipteronia dyeriana]|uniref:Uncharacterized protein n=1 Tax=Dipteronia dyeriana TaxID=168575 RepID=A0AAD9XFZ6_9ROSI|nr:hypothetical protein Ddye_005145 [Dipteronia dyeriana]
MGDGKSISIYRDKWIPISYTFRIIYLPKLNGNAKVEQLISPSGGWNVPLIRHNFTQEDKNAILKIPITRGNMCDNMLWHYNENDLYFVKSGYWLGCGLDNLTSPSDSSPLNLLLNTFWRAKFPLKVKIFIGKACQDWIPTKINIGRQCVLTNGGV